MKKRSNWLNRMALGLELPGESLPKAPIIELVGDRRILIENHKGVIAYGCNEIKVRMSFGAIAISGNSLQLAHMSRNQLVITGQIDCVQVNRGKCS